MIIYFASCCGFLHVAVNTAAMLRKNKVEEEWTFPFYCSIK